MTATTTAMTATTTMTETAATPAEPTAAEPTTTETLLDYANVYAHGYPITLARVRRALTSGDHGAAVGRQTEFSGDGLLPEDLAQEVWLRVWRSWPLLAGQPEAVTHAWAHTTARKLVIDRYRRRTMEARHGRIRLTDDLWDYAQKALPDHTLDDQPDVVALDRELLDELRAFVARASVTRATRNGRALHLDPALFQALVDGETHRETAARLGLTPNVVKTAQWRLCQRLRVHLRSTQSDADNGDDCVTDADDEVSA